MFTVRPDLRLLSTFYAYALFEAGNVCLDEVYFLEFFLFCISILVYKKLEIKKELNLNS